LYTAPKNRESLGAAASAKHMSFQESPKASIVVN